MLVALFWAALAVLLAIAILHTRTTLRWVVTAVFLALAFDPAVGLIERIKIGGRNVPRVAAVLSVLAVFLAALTFLVLHVIPPTIKNIEGLAKKAPTYVSDFEQWAEDNEQFNELNQKYDLTDKLSEQASSLPSKLGDAAGDAGQRHGQRARAPARRDHDPDPDRVPAARGQGHVPARHRPLTPAPQGAVPARRHPDRRRGALLRQRQPAAGDRRRPLHLDLPRDRGLPPGAGDGGAGRRSSTWCR